MILNEEGWHYLAIRKLCELLKRMGIFVVSVSSICLEQNKKTLVTYKTYGNNDFCCVGMLFKENMIL